MRMQPFNLMSFNIGGYSINCENMRDWDSRLTLCNAILLRYNADLIGFQEVQEQNRITLDEQLAQYKSEYGWKTISLDDNIAFYNPIYWKPQRFEKLDSGCFYLSQEPKKWSKAWDAMHVRGTTWVILRCLLTGAKFLFMNVHLDHYGYQSRIESSKVIVRQAEQLRQQNNLPVIVAGDFNARAWAPNDEDVSKYPPPVLPKYLPVGNAVHQVFIEQNYKDAYLEAGNKNQLAMNTYHDYYGDMFPPVALRIDWILTLDGYQHIQAEKYTLICDAAPPIYASDHYPIMAELLWK